MSARVTVTTEAVASPPPGVSTASGQAFILGQTQKGPDGVAVAVSGLADFRSVFGERSGGTDTFDTVEAAFKEGLANAYIVRLTGPSAAASSATVGTLTVTATSVGAWGNSVAVEWVDADSALIVDGAEFAAGSVATLQALLSLAGAPVTVSGSSLPSGDVAEANLSGGTDDADNAVVADLLALFGADLGDGAVTVAGGVAADVASDLATHCLATERLGLVAATSGATLSEATSELTDCSYPLVLLWPEGTAGAKTYSPVGPALGARAKAHASGQPVQSPISPSYGTMQFITGVASSCTDDEWKTANAAGLSIIRPVGGQVRLFGWRCVEAPDGVLTLQGANYRDLIDRVAVGAQRIADEFVGSIVDGRGYALADFAGRLVGFLESVKGSLAPGDNDPGYLVDAGPSVNPTAQIANGQISANVSIRCAGTAEFVTIAVTATDVAGVL